MPLQARRSPTPIVPPHFYAQGNNPQFQYHAGFYAYVNRVSHLISDGTHRAVAAVLYHAKAEWAGDYMLFQKPARELMRHQIDFDVVSTQMLLTESRVDGGRLGIHNEQFTCLVIPYAEVLSGDLLLRLRERMDQGLPVYFVGCEDYAHPITDNEVSRHRNWKNIGLSQLAETLAVEGHRELWTSEYQPWLRTFHYQHPGTIPV